MNDVANALIAENNKDRLERIERMRDGIIYQRCELDDFMGSSKSNCHTYLGTHILSHIENIHSTMQGIFRLEQPIMLRQS